MDKAKITLTESNGVEHDITDSIAFMYDAIVQSLDWGSGFLDLEEELHIASVGVLAGYQVPEVIPLADYPQPRISHEKYQGSDGRVLRKKFNDDRREWEKGYGARAREVILAKLAMFDMTDEHNPPSKA